jgi:hypothetical protein
MGEVAEFRPRTGAHRRFPLGPELNVGSTHMVKGSRQTIVPKRPRRGRTVSRWNRIVLALMLRPVRTGRYPDCGTWIWSGPKPDPASRDAVRVRAGTLDDTSWVRPTVHFWTRRAQPWVLLPEGDQKFEPSRRTWLGCRPAPGGEGRGGVDRPLPCDTPQLTASGRRMKFVLGARSPRINSARS